MEIIKILEKMGVKKYTTYGDHIAKVEEDCKGNKNGKLILVTAMSPTKSGNGKTTVSIGLADALNKKSSAVLSLREPSMGPVFGMKGGATGGGKCRIEPSNEINLHFTGDMHAITSANNLICACIDNSIFQGNELNIDINKILFNRCLDCNDRALRDIVVGDKDHKRKENFVITPASEIMAILCLSKDFRELKKNIANIMVAQNMSGEPVYVKDLGITDAVCGLLINAIRPNIVATTNGTPAFVHGGPFANIAHGASTIIATKLACSFGDYAITEAGFGADLGAEKFFDVVCPKLGKYPDCVVLIATVNAVKYNGDGDIQQGLCNLQRHIDNLKNKLGANVVVTVNRFTTDTDQEIEQIISFCNKLKIPACQCQSFSKGAKGAEDLANLVIDACKKKSKPHSLYLSKLPVDQKIEMVAQNIYGAGRVVYSSRAQEQLEYLKKYGYSKMPVVIAKTQYSFTADANVLGAPSDFELLVTDLQIRSGAGFVVAICGKMLLMPALSKTPNATKMKLKNKELTNVQ